MPRVLLLTDLRHRVEAGVAREALGRLHPDWPVTELDTSPRPDRAVTTADTLFAADERVDGRPYTELYLEEGAARAAEAAASAVAARLGGPGGSVTISSSAMIVGPIDADGGVLDFTGFDPRFPWRHGLGVDSKSVCEQRVFELSAAGWVPPPPDRVIGRLSHSPELAAAVRASPDRVPNPYEPEGVGPFMEWLTDPRAETTTGVSRYADLVWASRPDLAAAFTDVRGEHAELFARWMWTSGLREGVTHVEFLPDPPNAPSIPRRSPVASTDATEVAPEFGVNLVGYHAAEAGLGVAVRRVARALEASAVPWRPLTYDRTGSRQRDGADVVAAADGGNSPYWFHLILVTPEQLGQFGADVGAQFFAGHYTIGLWYWETDVMPSSHRLAIELVDEVWGATGYLRDVFTAHTDKPVLRMPLPLEFARTPDRATGREVVGFDDRFTFLFSFDFLSVARRKNPLGLVDAYRRAFPEPGDTRLILKSINGDQFPDERARIAYEIADRSDIELWDRYLESDERLSLVGAADCYVSLHRSEGLGLTMAEAMSAGTPVIASRYSGNLDFMDDESALLIDGVEVDIGPDNFYPPDGHWFDPDLDQAADAMKRVVSEPELCEQLAESGLEAVERFSVQAAAKHLDERLGNLWANRPNC